VANTNGQATGVLEVYLPYDSIAAELRVQTRHTIWRLGGGLGVLYMVLALISWYTTRKLRRHADQREHQSLHDGLTGLPNREWFRARAEEALERGQRGEQGAIVLVDLDHFKEVNDTLGHLAGDELLKVVAQRLSAALRTDDTVARLGGDEFGLILPRATDQVAILELLTRVAHELAAEIVLGTVSLSIEASFGVAFYPDHGDDLETLLQHADSAMYQGKRGSASLVVYEPGTPAHATHSLTVQQELRQALELDQLVLHYQPKIELATGRVCGVEALIRWQHPERGLLLPASFLPEVERSGLITPLTAWVLRRALRDQAEWTARDATWTVAVNVSARNLESADFPASVATVLTELGASPERLHIEVTETALAVNAAAASRAVTALAALGIDIAIDDFGIGYTSILQLRTLDVAEVKIDRAFISGLSGSPEDRAIVRSLIELAHGIGCRVTAEGVETQDVADWLAEAGCDYAQGYLFARPQPWPDLTHMLATSTDRLPADDDVDPSLNPALERSPT
jgi:diguanylate cyclase (GGDEF)-like protein